MPLTITAAMQTALAADVVHHVLMIRIATFSVTQRWISLPWNMSVDVGAGAINWNGLGAIEQANVNEIELASSLSAGRFSFVLGVIDTTLLNILLGGLKDAQIYRAVYDRAANSVVPAPILLIDGRAHLGAIEATETGHNVAISITSKTHVIKTATVPSRTHEDQLRRGAALGEANDGFLKSTASMVRIDLSRPNFVIKTKGGFG